MCKFPVCTTLVIFLTVVFCLNGGVLAQNDTMPTLRGDDAVRELKQTGGYDSLVDAFNAARGDQEPIVPDAVGQSAKLIASDGGASDSFGISLAISGDAAIIGALGDDIGANTDQGSAYIFVRSGTTWTQQAQLTASDGAANDWFGGRVAISGDTAVVGAFTDDIGANTDQGSVYVFVRSGTTWTQQTQLTAADGSASDRFGFSVAVSGDTAVVGAHWDDIGGNLDIGSAYVFVRSGTTWLQQVKLTPSDGAANDQFGVRVALSGDTAVVGANLDNISASDQGSAYVFVRSGATWSQQAKLIATDAAANDQFGGSVAVDGDTAIVGAYLDDVGANTDQGSAYVFVRSGTTWTQQAKLTASDGAANDFFGSVAISGDTVVVGAYVDDVVSNTNQGSAYVFVRAGSAWAQQTKLTASDGAANDWFGSSVAVSGDTVLVSAHLDDIDTNADQGSTYVFRFLGNSWTQETMRVPSDGAANDFFGEEVAISGDTAIVGALGDDVGANANQGSAYVFVRSGTGWTEQAKLTASDGLADDGFGWSVGVSGDTAIVGAALDDGPVSGQGSAYVFVRSGTTWTQQAKLIAPDGTINAGFGVSVAVNADTAIIGARQDSVGANLAQGSAYVFIRSGTVWTQQAKLTASDGAANDIFGVSVALEANTAIVGAYLDDVGANTDQGSAYLFVRSGTSWSQQAKMTASDGAASDEFGYRVGLSGDTAVVSSDLDDVGVNANQGSAYVFLRSGTSWSQQAKLTASDGAASDNFGNSIAISGDTVVVGSYLDNGSLGADQGSAYVFVRSGTSWTQSAKLLASDTTTLDEFGSGVAISGDKIVVGAIYGGASFSGSAYFFTNTPVAANVSISGRVLSSSGRGVANAFVTISGSNGFFRSVDTGRLGNFVFNNVPNWRTYILTANQRRFIFSAKVVNITESVSNLDFIAGQ